MLSNHHFKVILEWPNKPESIRTNKNHRIKIENKPDLHISAAKSFKGDSSLYNPEDLLLSSLVSCHMMSYLYCCSLDKINVISYQDEAEAILEVNPDGSGRIVKVILNPKVIIENKDQVELAKSLNHKANQLCFIANSCNFEVIHNIIIS